MLAVLHNCCFWDTRQWHYMLCSNMCLLAPRRRRLLIQAVLCCAVPGCCR